MKKLWCLVRGHDWELSYAIPRFEYSGGLLLAWTQRGYRCTRCKTRGYDA